MMMPGMPMMTDAMGAMWWWAVASAITAAALVALVAYAVVRDRSRPSGDDPRRILDARLARGEIGAEEYRDRRALLG